MNSISFSFWSGSRSSVKSTRRNVFQRASNAANDAATPTLRSSVKRKSRVEKIDSIVFRESLCLLTLANPALRVKEGSAGPVILDNSHGHEIAYKEAQEICGAEAR